jgi:hypothetical protein
MEENQSVFDLQMDETASRNLLSMSGWAKFLAVAVFAGLGLFVLLILLVGSALREGFSSIPNFPMNTTQAWGLIVGVVVFVSLIVFVVMYFLYKGANLIAKGIRAKHQETYNAGLASLKTYFAIMGIFSILGALVKLITAFNN